MPNNADDSIYSEDIKWLYDIGCDVPLNVDKRSFHGLISRPFNSNDELSDRVISENINL